MTDNITRTKTIFVRAGGRLRKTTPIPLTCVSTKSSNSAGVSRPASKPPLRSALSEPREVLDGTVQVCDAPFPGPSGLPDPFVLRRLDGASRSCWRCAVLDVGVGRVPWKGCRQQDAGTGYVFHSPVVGPCKEVFDRRL